MIKKNLIDTINAYRCYNPSIDTLPPTYVIEPTSLCNYKCIMCTNRFHRDSNKGFMKLELFIKIIDEIADFAKAIHLYWTGEPLLHQQLLEMISYVKLHSHSNVILSTNGSLLNGMISELLIKTQLDYLILSLDANSAETYNSIRKGGDWEIVNKNLETYFKILGDSKRPKTIIKIIKMKINQHEVNDFIVRWSRYHCKPVVSWFNTWANQLKDIENLSDYLCPNRFLSRLPCAELWFKIVIRWDGKVVLCCHDWEPIHILGDVNKTSISEIWNSDQFEQIRRVHANNMYHKVKLCRNCIEWSLEEEQFDYYDVR